MDTVKDFNPNYTHYSTGICSGCAVCQQEHGLGEDELHTALENGAVNDDGEFSWQWCEWCNSPLGGQRHCAHARNPKGEIEHFMVCADCMDC